MDSVEMELQNYYTRQRQQEAVDAGLVEPAPPAPPPPSDMEKLGSFAKSLGLDLEPGAVETLLQHPSIQPYVEGQVLPMELIKGLDAVLKIVGVPFKAVGLAAQTLAEPIFKLNTPDISPEALQTRKDVVGTMAEFATPLLYKALGAAAPHVAREFNRLMLLKGEAGALNYGAGEGIRGFLGPSGEHYLAGREGHRFADVAREIREKGVRYRMVEEPGRGIATRLAVDIRKPLTDAERAEIMKMARNAEQTVVDYPGGTGQAHTLDDVRRLLQETDSFFGQARTSALANEISGVHAQAGGSTFNLTTGKNLVGQEGYAVSTFKGHEKILDHAPTAQDIEQYISSLPAEIRSNPNLSLGTWESGGKHYLDVSQVEPDLNKALALGQQHQQQAVFDLKNLKDIPVPGAQSVGAAASKLAPGGTVQMNRVLAQSNLPSLQKAVDFFHAGEFNRDWYKGVAEELQKNFGDKADMMARLIAATSPLNDPKDNVNVALKIFNQVAGKDTSGWTSAKWQKVASAAGVIYPKSFAGNISAAVGGGDLRGLKVQNFYKALSGDPNAVVVDRWMSRFYLGPERRQGSPSGGFGVNESEYALIRGKILSGANALGVPPSEFQAAIWAAQKMITEGKSAADFPKMADTIRRGVAEAEKRGLIPAKTSAAMKTTMGLAVAIALGQTNGS